MKRVVLISLFAFCAMGADVQKNNFFGDIGVTGGANVPGVSFTYSRKVSKRIGIGAGVQGYDNRAYDGSITTHQIIPAVFADLRFYRPIKKRSLFFDLFDLGMNFYRSKPSSNSNELPHSYGVYTGLGVGYCYKIKPRLGVYATLKLAFDSYIAKEMDPVTQKTSKFFAMDGVPVLSVGVKF